MLVEQKPQHNLIEAVSTTQDSRSWVLKALRSILQQQPVELALEQYTVKISFINSAYVHLAYVLEHKRSTWHIGTLSDICVQCYLEAVLVTGQQGVVLLLLLSCCGRTQTCEVALHFARRQQARASHASQQLHQHVSRAFSSQCQSVAKLGDTLPDVDTPALLVDLDGE